MKDTLVNKLGSYQSSLGVAYKDENLPIWQTRPPLRFTEAIADAGKSVEGLASKGAIQSESIKGFTQALKVMRKQFERDLHVLARATYRCLLSLNRVEDAAKVDLTPTNLHDARAVALAGMGEVVLDLAEVLSKAGGGGEAYGVTDVKYASLNTQWQKYSVAVGAPITARGKRFALTHELPRDFAATENLFSELDDLIVQFRGTPEGDLFVDTWFQSRHVIDLGHGHAAPAPSPAPTTTTTTTTPNP